MLQSVIAVKVFMKREGKKNGRKYRYKERQIYKGLMKKTERK